MPRFKCNDCGFEARIFPLAIVDLEKLNQLNKKKSVKKKKVNKTKKNGKAGNR